MEGCARAYILCPGANLIRLAGRIFPQVKSDGARQPKLTLKQLGSFPGEFLALPQARAEGPTCWRSRFKTSLRAV